MVVTDSRGRHVAGLTQDNFRVYENRRLQASHGVPNNGVRPHSFFVCLRHEPQLAC
jgi:hypothetical protein